MDREEKGYHSRHALHRIKHTVSIYVWTERGKKQTANRSIDSQGFRSMNIVRVLDQKAYPRHPLSAEVSVPQPAGSLHWGTWKWQPCRPPSQAKPSHCPGKASLEVLSRYHTCSNPGNLDCRDCSVSITTRTAPSKLCGTGLRELLLEILKGTKGIINCSLESSTRLSCKKVTPYAAL